MVDQDVRTAIYARVSSDRQAEAGTVLSQVDALKSRVSQDGLVVEDELCFVDDGYSGATLARPAMERLRDVAAAGAVDRVYVHSPDRLARKHAYQVLLVEELSRCGVEIVFVNHDIRQDPEGVLLLQVQGMIAEYERAKILERSRRGKLHAARRGSVNVLSGAPYGYRYLGVHDGNGEGEYRVYLEEARVVRRIFEWIGGDGLSLGEVKRRLHREGIPSPKGKATWDRSSIWGMLKNPAYKGKAAYGKTRIGERRGRLRPVRGSAEHPRRNYSTFDVPEDAWTYIPVPPIVSEDLFASVQDRLAENRKRARQRRRGATYLLQGLLVCTLCGYALYGKGARGGRSKKRPQGRRYTYYRCIGSDAHRFGGQRLCKNTQVRTDLLEDAVWTDVCAVLSDPTRVEAEFNRRLNAQSRVGEKQNIEQLRRLVRNLKRGIARLIDAYGEGFLEKSEFEPRIRKARERLERADRELKGGVASEEQNTELKLIITRLEQFSKKIQSGLHESDWSTQREILRSMIKRVEVAEDKVRVVYRVDPRPFVEGPLSGGRSQHCWRRNHATLRGSHFHVLAATPSTSAFLVLLFDRRRKPHLDQLQDLPVADPSCNRAHETVVRDGVEVLREIRVNYIREPSLKMLVHLTNRVLCRLLRPVCVCVVCEIRFEDRLQYDFGCCLDDSITNRRDPQRAFTSVCLRYVHAADCLRLVRPGLEFLLQLGQKLAYALLLDLCKGHPVNPWRATIVSGLVVRRCQDVIATDLVVEDIETVFRLLLGLSVKLSLKVPNLLWSY